MLYIHKIYSREFKAENSKQAYLKACKFVAKHVISDKSKVEASKVVWDVQKINDSSLPTYLLTLYFRFDDSIFKAQTCKACKEFHCSFFVNEEYNCSRCTKIGYEKNIQKKLQAGSNYIKERLDDKLAQL